MSSTNQNSPEDLPSVLHYIKSNAVAGLNNVEDTDGSYRLDQETTTTVPLPKHPSGKVS